MIRANGQNFNNLMTKTYPEFLHLNLQQILVAASDHVRIYVWQPINSNRHKFGCNKNSSRKGFA